MPVGVCLAAFNSSARGHRCAAGRVAFLTGAGFPGGPAEAIGYRLVLHNLVAFDSLPAAFLGGFVRTDIVMAQFPCADWLLVVVVVVVFAAQLVGLLAAHHGRVSRWPARSRRLVRWKCRLGSVL